MKVIRFILILVLLFSVSVFPSDRKLITPDQPEYVQVLTDELLNITFLEKPLDKAAAFEKMADKRLAELEAMIEKKEWTHSRDLLKSYSDIVKNGIVIKKDGIYNSDFEQKRTGNILWNQGSVEPELLKSVVKSKKSFFDKYSSVYLENLRADESESLKEV